jgi:hypothetical protein
MIDGAKEQFAKELIKTNGVLVTEADLLIYLRKMPGCPGGGTYRIGRVGEPPKCSRSEHWYP